MAGLGTLGDASRKPGQSPEQGPGLGQSAFSDAMHLFGGVPQESSEQIAALLAVTPTRKKRSAGRRKGRQEVAMPVVHFDEFRS